MLTNDELKARLDAQTAPKITMEHIRSLVVKEFYHHFPGTTLCVCVLLLKNGFTVTGESACADPANWDPDIGEKIAADKAYEKIWALEGYLLRQRLYDEALGA